MRRDEAGFTIIEVLLAMFLLGLMVLAVVGLFAQAVRFGGASKDLGGVGACAVVAMEQLRGQSFASLTAGGNLGSNDAGFSDLSNPTCAVRWTIADDAAPPRIKTITVRSLARRRVLGLEKEVTFMTRRTL